MELLVFSLESVYSPFLNCWNSSSEGFGPTYANKKADIDNDNDDNDFNERYCISPFSSELQNHYETIAQK